MICRLAGLTALALVIAPGTGVRLTAQAQIFGEEAPLDPMRKALKAEVLVLRDTLYAVDATSARLVRAKIGNTPSVVTASARVLQSDCTRAARAAVVMREKMASVGTTDKRGKAVLSEYNTGLDNLARAMTGCSRSLGSALAAPKAPMDPLFRIALTSAEALKQYDARLSKMLRTLQIPVDPKGFKSALKT